MKSNLVPFGKYRGRPLEEMALDREYCDWLMAQPWFAERYRDVYHVVVNYGGEPQDSPEHNQLQARLLDDEFCISVIRNAYQSDIDPEAQLASEPENLKEMMQEKLRSGEAKSLPITLSRREFEHRGWDCVVALGGGISYNADRFYYYYGPSHFTFGIECKPSIGEDFPSVLRQVKGFPSGGVDFRRIVLTQSMNMQSVRAAAVAEMFASSGIRLVIVK